MPTNGTWATQPSIHIETMDYSLEQWIEAKRRASKFALTNENCADFLTKALSKSAISKCLAGMSVGHITVNREPK